MTILPADDHFHAPGANPHWSETGWFHFNVRERGINGWVYLYHRLNMHYSVGGIAIWNDTGSSPSECLYWDYGPPHPLTANADVLDFTLPSGLTVAQYEPNRGFRVTYESETCRLALFWDAVMEPHDSSLGGGGEAWGSGHFEQLGRATGSLILDGEELAIDCWSMRDRSWGAREPVASGRLHFPWGASDSHAFVCFAPSLLPPEDDPMVGTVETAISGWFRSGGQVGDLTGAHASVVERGADGRPLRVEIHGTDSLGRRLDVEGRCRASFDCHLIYPWMNFWWSAFEWTINGESGWGEELDCAPLAMIRRFVRTGAQAALN